MQWTIGKRLGFGFGCITFLLLAVGYVSINGARQDIHNTERALDSYPYANAAMELRYTLARQMQMLMEVLVVTDPEGLEDVIEELEVFIGAFTAYSNALLKGGDTPKGAMQAAVDPETLRLAQALNKRYNQSFAPGINEAVSIKRKLLNGQGDVSALSDQLDRVDTAVDAEGEALIALTESLEEAANDVVESHVRTLYDEAETNGLLSIVGVVGGALIAVILSMVIARTVNRQLQRLSTYVGAVSAGNLNAPAPTGLTGEIRSLSTGVEAMVDTLKNKLGFSQGFMEAVTTPVVVVDPDERVTFTNQPMIDFLDLNCSTETCLGKKLGDFFYGDASRKTLCGQVMAERKPVIARETELEIRGGKTRYVKMDISPVYDTDGAVIAGVAMLNDLTAIREQGQRIEQQRDNIAATAAQANDISEQLASASEELSAQVDESSTGASEQSSLVGEATTAMEQMNATVMEVARNASEAAGLASSAIDKAREGSAVVQESIESINQLDAMAKQLRTDMTELGEKAEGIGQIITVIEDIADQTNLLALNAAIEAARAGEAGRGFAVVADEVRKLAENTMSATKDVANYITAIQNSARANMTNADRTGDVVARSTEKVRESGAMLEAIVHMVQQTGDQVQSIATASEEQSAASEQINRSMEQINRISAETSMTMEQSAQAVSDLASLAQRLKTVIDSMSS